MFIPETVEDCDYLKTNRTPARVLDTVTSGPARWDVSATMAVATFKKRKYRRDGSPPWPNQTRPHFELAPLENLPSRLVPRMLLHHASKGSEC